MLLKKKSLSVYFSVVADTITWCVTQPCKPAWYEPRCLKFLLHHLIRLFCATILHKSVQVQTRQTRQMRVICARKKTRQQVFWHNAETRLRVVLTWLYSTRGGIMLHLCTRLIFYSVWFKYTEQAEISVIEMWGNAAVWFGEPRCNRSGTTIGLFVPLFWWDTSQPAVVDDCIKT